MRILNIEPTPDSTSENKDQEVSEAIARQGDWEFPSNILSNMSETVFNNNWESLGNVDFNIATDKNLVLAKLKNDKCWILGYWDEIFDENLNKHVTKFVVVFRIQMEIVNNIGRKFGYDKLYQVKEVSVLKAFQGLSIAYNMYKWLVNNNDFAILGDRVQYFGARKLWAKLSQSIDVKVDAIDRTNDSFLEKDIVLIHGQYDAEFDKRVWSQDVSKADTLLVLTQVLN